MPRPNPPRKRPRRRPDAVERSARAEVSLTKQRAQVKERNGAPEPKSPNAKPGGKGAKGGPPPKLRKIDEPYVPWAKRSYAILVVLLAIAETVIGGLAWFTLSAPRPDFGVFLLGVNADSLGPLIAVAAALLAAQFAKYIAKETRALRFMESAIVGVTQYFIWLALFVGLVYLLGLNATTTGASNPPSSTSTPLATTPASPTSTSPAPTATATPSGSTSTANAASTVATPVQVAGLAVVDVLSFVLTFYIYPPLYKRLRIKPPPPRTPRPPKDPKPNDATAKGPTSRGGKTNVERMDDAATQDSKPRDPTP
jgi:hypothetical protein